MLSFKKDSQNKQRIAELNTKINEWCENVKGKRVILGFTGGFNSRVLYKLLQPYCSEIKCVFIETRYTCPQDMARMLSLKQKYSEESGLSRKESNGKKVAKNILANSTEKNNSENKSKNKSKNNSESNSASTAEISDKSNAEITDEGNSEIDVEGSTHTTTGNKNEGISGNAAGIASENNPKKDEIKNDTYYSGIDKNLLINEITPYIIIDKLDLNEDILILNPKERDFFCKNSIFDLLNTIKNIMGYDLVVDATPANIYDELWGKESFSDDYLFPFKALNINSNDVQLIGENLSIKRKYPHDYNLLSRFRKGVSITKEMLASISRAETYLKELLNIDYIRVNALDEKNCLIEIPKKEIKQVGNEKVREQIVRSLHKFGFDKIGLDLQGFSLD